MMRRELVAVVVGLSAFLAQSSTALAAAQEQHSSRQAAGHVQTPAPPSAPAAPPQGNPPTGTESAFQSTLKFEPSKRADDHVTAPLPVDRFGRPFVLATPWLLDGGMGHVVANGPLSYALPSSAAPGGVQLDVQPWRAQVYVDGTYVGVVRDFTGYYHHLEVGAGPHVIAIVTPDYEPLVLELFVSPGRVTTYHGTLSPASGR